MQWVYSSPIQPVFSPDDRLNIYYMVLEKLSTFAEGKYDVSLSFHDVATDYEAKRPDALQQIEDMAITKRIVSTCRDCHHSSMVGSVQLFSISSAIGAIQQGDLWW